MKKFAIIMSALLLSACSIIAPKKQNEQESQTIIVVPEKTSNVVFTFLDDNNEVVQIMSNELKEFDRMKFNIDTLTAHYNVTLAYYSHSCKYLENTSYYKYCEKPEQVVLFARGFINQSLKNNDNANPKVDDFRILNVVKDNNPNSPKFKTRFSTDNLTITWRVESIDKTKSTGNTKQ